MNELFWFFLGGLVYIAIGNLVSFYKKTKFLNEIKIYSLQLIGFAYEQLIFSTAAKYISLKESGINKEKIKIFKNADETAFEEWKKETVNGLKKSVPLYYRDALDIENWDDIMNTLDNHYKQCLDYDIKEQDDV